MFFDFIIGIFPSWFNTVILYVDGAKDNPTTGAPCVAQQIVTRIDYNQLVFLKSDIVSE